MSAWGDFGIWTLDRQPQLQEKPEIISDDDGESVWYGAKQRRIPAILNATTRRIRSRPPAYKPSATCYCNIQVLLHIFWTISTGRTPRSAAAKIRSNTAEERYPLTLERTASTADELERAEFDVVHGYSGMD